MLVIPDQSHLLRGEQLPPFEQGNKTRAKDQKVNSSLRVDPKKEETRIDCKLTVSSDARLAYENPDVPAEELEKMLEKYEGREAQRELDRG